MSSPGEVVVTLWWRCAAFVGLALMSVGSSGAQTVRGTIVGRGDVPIPGVVVVLADSAGPVGRSLSGERGEFRVTASRPGTYRLQATRIGFRPVVSAWMTLAANDTRDQRLVMDGISRPDPRTGLPYLCYANVYLDGLRLYGGGESEIVPDINRFEVAGIESIEYYASAAQTPAKYSALNSTCGVLVIRTRRFP